MERHHKLRKTPPLNLVSLMDIFTILVFFLLVNSSNPEQLSNSEDLKLPSSQSNTVPEETVTIAVTKNDILVQGRRVAGVVEAMQLPGEIIPALQQELEFLAGSGQPLVSAVDGSGGRPITIMGDESIPYELIRKLLMTSQQTDFTRIAFATTQRVLSPEAEPTRSGL